MLTSEVQAFFRSLDATPFPLLISSSLTVSSWNHNTTTFESPSVPIGKHSSTQKNCIYWMEDKASRNAWEILPGSSRYIKLRFRHRFNWNHTNQEKKLVPKASPGAHTFIWTDNILYTSKSNKNGYATGLALIERLKTTRKLAIPWSNTKELCHLAFDHETTTNYFFDLKEGKHSSSATL